MPLLFYGFLQAETAISVLGDIGQELKKVDSKLVKDLLEKNQVHLVHSQRVESKLYSKLKEIPQI